MKGKTDSPTSDLLETTRERETTDVSLPRILSSMRRHLDMDIAFISVFDKGERIFRSVDAAYSDPPICVGGSDPLEGSYCQRVVDGRLPELIQDASQNSVALALPATLALPIGAHLSVPLRFSDGSVYGTFCCFSHTADTTLNDRDLATMRVFADFIAEQLESEVAQKAISAEIRKRIESVLVDDVLSMRYQPIFNVHEDRIVGFEALARFIVEPYRTPDVWFNEAAEVGLAAQLELVAAERALQGLEQLPTGVYISVNLSAKVMFLLHF